MKFILLLLLLAAPAWAGGIAKHVIVVSIDGGKPATIRTTEMPVLKKFAAEGAAVWNALTIVPNVTLPSHGSMVSGVKPEAHGLTWNDYQPDRGLIRVPTMFSIAKEAGFSTALFTGKEKFKHLNLPKSLDQFSLVAGDAKKVATEAANYLKDKKPNLILVHFADADVAGHEFGWESPQFVAALKVVDAGLGQLRAAIEEAGMGKNTLLIITADHGGSKKNHATNIPEHQQIPWIVWGTRVNHDWKPSRTVSTMDTPATALWALGLTVPGYLEGKPLQEAFTN